MSDINDSLKAWILDMVFLYGVKLSTRKRYFGKLHALYLAAEVTDSVDPFSELSPLLGCEAPDSYNRAVDNVSLVTKLIDRANRERSDQLCLIFLYLLYEVNSSVSDVIGLKFGEMRPVCDQIYALIDSIPHDPRRKYVFALNQGKSREGNIANTIISRLHKYLINIGFEFGGRFSRDSIMEIWLAKAISIGVPPVVALAMIGRLPYGYDTVNSLRCGNISPEQKRGIISRVANAFDSNATGWYVMKLRRGTTADDIKARIRERCPSRLVPQDYYYPSRVVVINKNGRRVKAEQPYIPELLFFKTNRNAIAPLFAEIGDQAWCYRVGLSSDSQYSRIPNYEMKLFQKVVGQFTDDIHMEIVESCRSYDVGQTVSISGGEQLLGQQGVIRKKRNKNGTTTYLLQLSGVEAMSWTVELDESMLEPIQVEVDCQ